ncbi:MAG: MBL fold metallo-hydrolase [Spirochaetaceae bacterium]|nr:MAG: MBL fold metallo-hydrolase [Spirochaetaceae bacterium]
MKLRFSPLPCAAVPLQREEMPAGVALRIHWLGQAGFLIDSRGLRLVIDPYLSDSLAEKYRGKRFAHTRMMAPPIAPSQLCDVDWVLSTHSHTDHLDPGTLPLLAQSNPACRFLVPRSAESAALQRGVPADRLVLCNTGDSITLPGTAVSAAAARVAVTPAAHEQRQLDDAGNDIFLGYVIDFNGVTVYHSGDTVPFAGLRTALAGCAVDIALLPVNGRDEQRTANGVPGNMTLDEAIDLACELDVVALIGHHFDMFDFNTLDRGWGEDRIAERLPNKQDRYLLARPGLCYEVGNGTRNE